MDSGRMGRYEANALGKAPLQNIMPGQMILLERI